MVRNLAVPAGVVLIASVIYLAFSRALDAPAVVDFVGRTALSVALAILIVLALALWRA